MTNERINEDEDFFEDILFGKSIFKDETTLLPEYVPPKLPGREEEIKRFLKDLRILFDRDKSFSTTIAIIGEPGYGKTALYKFTRKKLEQLLKKHNINAKMLYYNCYSVRSKTAILRGLLTEQFGIQSRGFSDEEIMTMLMKRLNQEGIKLIVGLDEATMLKPEEILGLLKINEYFGYEKSSISFVLISRVEDWQMILSAPLAGLVNDQIKLRKYTRNEIFEIIKYRAELALHEGTYNDEILEYISEMVASSGNMRYAIELLRMAARKADGKGDVITMKHVLDARYETFPELSLEVLSNLNLQELLSLLAIAHRLKNTGKSSTTIEDAYKNYKVLCEEYNEKARSMSSFRKFVDYLVKLELVKKSVGPVSDAKRGRRGKLSLMDMPPQIMVERLQMHLNTILKEKN